MKYYYDIDRYVYERPVNTSGNDKEPYWGEVKLNYDELQSKLLNYIMEKFMLKMTMNLLSFI